MAKELALHEKLDDLAIATDMLLSAKTAVCTYAIALTETATPKVHKATNRCIMI